MTVNLEQNSYILIKLFIYFPDELYGDFEDLETGKVHSGTTADVDDDDDGDDDKSDADGDDETDNSEFI